jgi:hypothetical protein
MLRELGCAWGVLCTDMFDKIPNTDEKAEFMTRAYKLLKATEYLADKESERKVGELCKQL